MRRAALASRSRAQDAVSGCRCQASVALGARRCMPYFVAVQYQARPDRLDDLLALIRRDLAVSTAAYPGRRFARVFRQDRDRSRLLGIEEWQQERDFQRHAKTPAYAEALTGCSEPPTV